MTCINWVRVRKGARPAGPRLQIEQLRTIAACVTGELVDFSLFVRFVLLLFYHGSPNKPKFKEERAGLGFFFLSFITTKKKRQPRFQLCDFGCGIRRSGSRSNH